VTQFYKHPIKNPLPSAIPLHFPSSLPISYLPPFLPRRTWRSAIVRESPTKYGPLPFSSCGQKGGREGGREEQEGEVY